MAKLDVRTLIQLQKQRDQLEADIRENQRATNVATLGAAEQLGMAVGDERIVKYSGEVWKFFLSTDSMKVTAISVDEAV